MITEYLWGDWISGSIALTNPSNMIDLAFNDVVSSWAMELGNVRYTSIQDTVESNYGVIQQVLCRVRFRTQGTLTKNSIEIGIKGQEAVWTTLETFNSSNQPPTVLTTKEYDVTSILNTISQINAANFTFDCKLSGGGSETIVEVDEIQLIIIKRGFNVFESVSATENALFILGVGLDKFDLVNSIESVSVYSEVTHLIIDTVSVKEEVTVSLAILNVEISDSIFQEENFINYLDVLNINVLDPFQCVITEHIDVLDLTVEIGVVIEAIYVEDIDSSSLDQLFTEVFDTILAGEFIDKALSLLYVNVLGGISVYEWLNQVIETLVITEYEEIALEEWISLLDLVVELEGIDNVSALENISCHLSILNITSLEAISIEEYSNIHDIIVELGISQDIGLWENVTLSPNPLYISVTQNIGVEEYVNIWDIIIELFAEDGVDINDYIITESYVRVYDWASVTGALVDFIGTVEIFAIYITELFTKHYEVIDVMEYLQVMSIMRPLFYQEVFISEFLGIDLRIEALLIDEINVEDSGTVYYPIFKLVFEDIDIEEFQLNRVLYWDLYPRIFIVQPRHRIFLRYKKAFPHRYGEYEMRRWHRFEKVA